MSKAEAGAAGSDSADDDAGSFRITRQTSSGVTLKLCERSLFAFRLDSPIRQAAIKLISHRAFDRFILFTILLNCVTLSLSNPVYTDPQLAAVLEVAELVFLAIFTLESLAKSIALGFLFGKNTYLRDPWNILDFLVVAMGYFSIAPGVQSVSELRTFRILRPLRTLTTIPGMRIVVKSMIAAIPALVNVAILCAFMFFLFGIVGVQLWEGLMRGRCFFESGLLDEADELLCALPCEAGDSCVPAFGRSCAAALNSTGQLERRVCRAFQNPNFGFTSFDNIGAACLTIFTSITLEGWVDVMYQVNDAYGLSVIVISYFVLLIMFGSFFLLNLTLAVIWGEYQRAEEEVQRAEAEAKAEADYQAGRELQRRLSMARAAAEEAGEDGDAAVAAEAAAAAAEEAEAAAAGGGGDDDDDDDDGDDGDAADDGDGDDDDSSRRKRRRKKKAGFAAVRAVVEHAWFDAFFNLLILSNTVFLAMEHHNMQPGFVTLLEVANRVFTFAFAVEMVVKLLGLGVREYLSSRFNVFDGVIVIISLVEVGITFANPGDAGGSGLLALRAFRLMRVFKLAKSWKELRDLLSTIARSVADVGNAAILLGVIMFIFSLLGMRIFGGKLDEIAPDGSRQFDEKPRANFDTLFWAFITVFQVLTGENWNEVLYDGMHAVGGISVVYFVALNVIGNYVILNLFMAVLLANFEEEEEEEVDMDDVVSVAAAIESGDIKPDVVVRRRSSIVDPRTRSIFATLSKGPLATAGAASAGGRDADSSLPPLILPQLQAYLASQAEGDSDELDAWESDAESVAGEGGITSSMGSADLRAAVADIVLEESDDDAASSGGGGDASDDYDDELSRHHRSMMHSSRVTSSGTPLGSSSSSSGGSFGDSHAALLVAGGSAASLGTLAAELEDSDGKSKEAAEAEAGEEERHPAAIAPAAAEEERKRTEEADEVDGAGGEAEGGEEATAGKKSEDTEGNASAGSKSSRMQPFEIEAAGKPAGKPAGSKPARRLERHKSIKQRAEEMKAAKSAQAARQRSLKPVLEGDRSFWLFGADSCVRRVTRQLIAHPQFDRTVLILIALSSVALALDEPRLEVCGKLDASDPDNCRALAQVLLVADYVLTTLFVIEMLLKMVAKGVLLNAHAYLRDGWDRLDFLVVTVSVLSLALDTGDLKAFRALRALRALRPLRMVQRYPALKLVVNAIFLSLPSVLNVTVISFVFFLVLGIVGVQNWMGSFNRCNDPDVSTQAACVGMFNLTGDLCSFLPLPAEVDACLANNSGASFPRLWAPPPQNFDNTGAALLTLFEVASGEMWPDIMMNAVDAVGPDQPAVRDYNPAAALYFVVAIIICSFLMLNLFVGVVVDNFNKMKQKAMEMEDGGVMLTPAQQQWVEHQKSLLKLRPHKEVEVPPGDRLRSQAVALVESTKFEMFIMAAIGLNVLFMASRHFGQPQWWSDALEGVNTGFTILFTIEAVVKIYALHMEYFARWWNRFDFFLVVASLLGRIINVSQFATLLRIFRVARLIRLVRTSPGLLRIIRSLFTAMPQIANVSAMLLLLFFIYAVAGMNIFASVKLGEFLTEHANFQSFGLSMLTLFRMSTGESYNGIMHDCSLRPPYCDPDVNCGFPEFSPIYFVTFFIVSSLLLVNLLVAIILDKYEAEASTTLTDRDYDAFVRSWAQLDPDASRTIPLTSLPLLLMALEPPLGLAGLEDGDLTPVQRCRQYMRTLDVGTTASGEIEFSDTLRALAKKASGDITLPKHLPQVEALERKLRKASQRALDMTVEYRLEHHAAAEVIQACYRGYRTRQRFRALVAIGLSQRDAELSKKYRIAHAVARRSRREDDVDNEV